MVKTDDVVKTVCPYCGVGCGVLATLKSNGSVKIAGDPDHPANFGRLCSKGTALAETIDLEGRLLQPEVAGEPVGWDEALDLVAEKFSAAIRDHGPDSVAFYVSGQILTEDYYVANKLMKGFIGSANIDTNSRLCMASSVAGHRRAFGMDTVPGCYDDLEQADLIVLVGSNLAWCHPVLYQRIAAAKEARPQMKVVLVDPRRTMTADLADQHLAIRTDGDVALFSGLFAHLARADVLDQAYIKNHTNSFEEAFAQAAKLTELELLRATGLTASELTMFYDLFASTDKTVTVYSQGVNQSACGTDKVNAIINCHLATGRIGKPGMGPFSVTGQPNAMGGREVGGLANMLTAHMNIEGPAHRDLVQRFWKSPTIAEKPGLKAVDMFDAVAQGQIKALWIMSTNPVDSMPDGDKVEAAIRNCPFVVVSDVLAETDTARHAHVKLPAAAWGEKEGTVTNSERRISRQKTFLEMPGEARADWWHLAEVAKRMGFAKAFEYKSVADIFREFASLSLFENQGERDFDIGAYAMIPNADYQNLKPFQWPQKHGERPQETRFFANGEFYTPDRQARFVSPSNSIAPVEIEAASSFILNTGRVRDHWHTMTRTGKSDRLSVHLAEPFAEIHPEDAAKTGIDDAELIEIENERGSITVRALITERQQRGHLFVPIHWNDQFASNARVDRLVSSASDPFSGQPALKMARVTFKACPVSLYGFVITREKPMVPKSAYWALAKSAAGWRMEFALKDESVNMELIKNMIVAGYEMADEPVSYIDAAAGEQRYGWFDGKGLVAALFLSRSPVEFSRSLILDALARTYTDGASRHALLAARASTEQADKGTIICACLNVGSNEIGAGIAKGCQTVASIGEATGAGTNCGSCRSEIAAILKAQWLDAAE